MAATAVTSTLTGANPSESNGVTPGNGFLRPSVPPNRLILLGGMVLQERIELSTSPLPRECSATELLQHSVHFIDL
jgi:hypothetical protein